MSNVLIVEQDDGRIGFFDPASEEYTSKGKTRAEYLSDTETEYIEQGIATHGVIDDGSIPTAPVGSSQDHLIWDTNIPGLAYDTTKITDAKRVDLNSQIGVLFQQKEATIQVTIGGVLFNDGDRMKQNLGLLAGVVSNGGSIPTNAKIRQADGTRVALTAQLHMDISNSLAQAHSDLLNSLEDHVDAIAAANDSVLDSYDVNADWP